MTDTSTHMISISWDELMCPQRKTEDRHKNFSEHKLIPLSCSFFKKKSVTVFSRPQRALTLQHYIKLCKMIHIQ